MISFAYLKEAKEYYVAEISMIIGVYLRIVDFSFKNLINPNPLITTLSRKIFSFRFECYVIFFFKFFIQKVCRKNSTEVISKSDQRFKNHSAIWCHIFIAINI